MAFRSSLASTTSPRLFPVGSLEAFVHLGFLCIMRALAWKTGWNPVPAPYLPWTTAITCCGPDTL